jgi:hypothetical protein
MQRSQWAERSLMPNAIALKADRDTLDEYPGLSVIYQTSTVTVAFEKCPASSAAQYSNVSVPVNPTLG